MWWFGTFLLDFYLNCFVFPFYIVLFLFVCHLLWLWRWWWHGLLTFVLSVHIAVLALFPSHSNGVFMAFIWLLHALKHHECHTHFCRRYRTACTLLYAGMLGMCICSFHLFHSFSIFIHFVIWFSIIEIVVRFVFFGLFYFILFIFVVVFFILLSFVYCMYSTQFFALGLNEFLLGQHLPKSNRRVNNTERYMWRRKDQDRDKGWVGGVRCDQMVKIRKTLVGRQYFRWSTFR